MKTWTVRNRLEYNTCVVRRSPDLALVSTAGLNETLSRLGAKETVQVVQWLGRETGHNDGNGQ
ncbi:MAG: hypothetical protein DWH78_12975 [Planctomycetota bacterium]|jgi:hypothetical protein|nr:MAG: hypothetical protein DWH78_12975 [Planctomycetota bacterium]